MPTLAQRDRNAAAAVDPGSLAQQSVPALDRLFASLEAPTPEQLSGSWRGSLIAVAGLDWLPGPVRRAVFDRSLWEGVSFDGEFGTNTWALGRDFARFLAHEAPALDAKGRVIRLDYDVAINPRPLRGLVGELRSLGPGLFLVRMRYRHPRGLVTVSYVVLGG